MVISMKGKELLFNIVFIIIYYIGNLYVGIRIQRGVGYFFDNNNYLSWISFLLASTLKLPTLDVNEENRFVVSVLNAFVT